MQASLASLVSTVGLLLRRAVPVVPQSYAQAVRPVRPQGPRFACGELGRVSEALAPRSQTRSARSDILLRVFLCCM